MPCHAIALTEYYPSPWHQSELLLIQHRMYGVTQRARYSRWIRADGGGIHAAIRSLPSSVRCDAVVGASEGRVASSLVFVRDRARGALGLAEPCKHTITRASTWIPCCMCTVQHVDGVSMWMVSACGWCQHVGGLGMHHYQ